MSAVISRRTLLSRLSLLAAGGAAVWLVRDRIPWPGPGVAFAEGQATDWIDIPSRAGLIEIPAIVNGQAIRVVVDSGAQFSAIDRGLARRLDLPQTVALPLLAYGVSGAPDLTHTVRLDLGLPGLSVRGMRAAALDIAGLSSATGRGFSMLVGRDVLREVIVEADFPRDRVRFLAPGTYSPPLDAIAVPLRMPGGAPTTAVRVEGSTPIDVLVDTGATGVLALSASAARAAGLLAPGRPVREAHSVSLGGLSLDQMVTASRVEVGGLTLRQVDVQIYAPAARGPVPAGLLGTGLLRRFRIALDLHGGALHLVPPTPTVTRRRGGN